MPGSDRMIHAMNRLIALGSESMSHAMRIVLQHCVDTTVTLKRTPKMGFQIYAGILCPVPAILLFYYTYTTGSYRVVGPFVY